MKERVQELTNEMNTAKEQKEVILGFIKQTEDIPPIVLETLKQRVRRLKGTIKDCEIRLKSHEAVSQAIEWVDKQVDAMS